MIDLRSDTVTRPGAAMRRAMADAEVGDDVFREDPTVIRLEEEFARLTGKPAALFCPSGTQANEIAVLIQSGPGTEVIVDDGCHIFNYEAGGAAAIAGTQLRPLRGDRGVLTAEMIAAAIRPHEYHAPQTRLICLENTHNRGGGKVYPIETMEAIAALARSRSIRVHLDGARLMNAVVASGVPASRFAAVADTVSICLSKGLGAPVGTCLAGDNATMEAARWARKRLGGGMRQAGILAAGCLYALHHNVERLAEDHANARRLSAAIAELRGIRHDPAEVETNILYFDVAEDAESFAVAVKEEGVLVIPVGSHRLRAVTHLDVSAADIDAAIAAFRRVAAN
jgi:threonine aldolase